MKSTSTITITILAAIATTSVFVEAGTNKTLAPTGGVIRESPAPSTPFPTEGPRESPAPSTPFHTEGPRESPAPSTPFPTVTRESPAPSTPFPTETEGPPIGVPTTPITIDNQVVVVIGHHHHSNIPFPSPTPPPITFEEELIQPIDIDDLSSLAATTPIQMCTGNGGACYCGKTSDGKIISMNRYRGDENDEKVWGCGGAFRLTGADWNSQWGGTLSESGPEANVLHSVGLGFSQDDSYDGWEGCCTICGLNLQLAGKISDGWYCEKDAFSTGIWLKGPKACWGANTRCLAGTTCNSCCNGYRWVWEWAGDHCN